MRKHLVGRNQSCCCVQRWELNEPSVRTALQQRFRTPQVSWIIAQCERDTHRHSHRARFLSSGQAPLDVQVVSAQMPLRLQH